MKVFKFGGASVKDAEAIRNVGRILTEYKGQKLSLVISAMGKTTNLLEEILEAFYLREENADNLLSQLITQNKEVCNELFKDNDVLDEITAKAISIPNKINAWRNKEYDFIYDQVVSIGEWISTKIVAAYLNQIGLGTRWLDAKDLLHTDDTYREGKINWEKTSIAVRKSIDDSGNGFHLTQGFLGKSEEGYTITLGREGSDYTAAILSFCLEAESMTVWKDVPGILNADPRKFSKVTKLDKISYKEAIEMTYYGAKVIHPKTIKPLQNKNIPMHVRSFLDSSLAGTIISTESEEGYPPIVVLEPNQTLLKISTKDFSFVAEHHLSQVFSKLAKHRIKVNMMRNTAISFSVCITHREHRLKQLTEELREDFHIHQIQNLELVTIRHWNQEIMENLKRGKIVLLEERIKDTLQMVVKDVPVPERI